MVDPDGAAKEALMPLRKSTPLVFRMRSVSDAIDASNVKTGAMDVLQNFVPSLKTKGVFSLRPAINQITDFSTVGYSIAQGELAFAIGSRIYGFVQVTSGLGAGRSAPFSYNTANNTFDPISGITGTNLPVSTSNVGDWTPPTCDLCGAYLVMTHPGFPGGASKFGWLNVSNPAAPAWAVGDLGTNPLFSTPVAVAQFNGRMYYAESQFSTLSWSDAGNAITRTNAAGVQALSFQNGLPITALTGQPMQTLTGGIVQALLVWQGQSVIQQITGDQTFAGGLQRNQLTNSSGTIAPKSIASTPYGTFFISHDGLRVVSLAGQVSEPIGSDGEGVQAVFINASTPTRIAAAFQEDVYRVSLPTIIGGVVGDYEYWFYPALKVWCGPHSIASVAVTASQTDQSFYLFLQAATGLGLWQSEVLPTVNSNYTEKGMPMPFTVRTCLLPDTEAMAENAVVETALACSVAAGVNLIVSAINESSVQLAVVTVPGVGGQGALWGSALWGQAVWGEAAGPFIQRRIPWPRLLVFKQMQVQLQGSSTSPVQLGNLYLRYQQTGYLMQDQPNAV